MNHKATISGGTVALKIEFLVDFVDVCAHDLGLVPSTSKKKVKETKKEVVCFKLSSPHLSNVNGDS
jgi:hypothetical protein